MFQTHSDTITESVDNLRNQLSGRIDSLVVTVKELSASIDSIKAEQRSIKTNQLKIEEDLVKLSSAINAREQHSRNSSIRIQGLQVSDETSKDPVATSEIIYSKLIYPILKLAQEDKIIKEVPSMLQTIEFSHTLPSRNPVSPSDKKTYPIICRFHSRLIRSLIFKYKRDFLQGKTEMKNVFISEDLTAVNFKKMMELKKDESILSAWSRGGKIFFKTKEDPSSRKSL